MPHCNSKFAANESAAIKLRRLNWVLLLDIVSP